MVIFNNIILILEKYWGLFLQGIGVTLMLSAIAVVFGILIGSLLALMRLSKFHIGRFRPLDFIATIYVEIIRGTPLLLQLYFFFFLLPMMIPALGNQRTVFHHIGTVFKLRRLRRRGHPCRYQRGGSAARPKLPARWDSTPVRRCCKIVFPQAVKNILPALCNEFVSIIKETSLASTFFVGDLMTTYKTINGCHLSVHRAADYRRYHLLPADLHPVQRNRCTGKEIKNK